MGMGHVPPGPLREAGEGDDVPGRQHRGAGAQLRHLTRSAVARLGEDIAAAFLARRGAEVIGRNVVVGRGEIDLLVAHDGELVAVEVKTIGVTANAAAPIERISDAKLRQVRRLAAQLRPHPARRVDFVGVRIDAGGAHVNWRTNVA